MLLLGRSSQPRRARPVNDGLEHPSRAWATSGIARGHKSAVSSLGETAGLLLRPVGEKKGGGHGFVLSKRCRSMSMLEGDSAASGSRPNTWSPKQIAPWFDFVCGDIDPLRPHGIDVF